MRGNALAALFLLAMASNSAFSERPTAPSLWKNQRNSILELESVDGDGVVRGSFTNHAENTGCNGVAYPIQGKITDGGLYFAATFPPCYTVSSWQGTISGDTLETRFTLYYPHEKTGDLIKVTGNSTFKRLR